MRVAVMIALQYLQDRLAGIPISLQVIGGIILLYLINAYRTAERPCPGVPIVTCDSRWMHYLIPAPLVWALQGRKIVSKGLKECPSCFQVKTGSGYKVILPSRFAEEIKNHPDLSFNEAFMKDFPVEYPGFEAFTQGLQDEWFIQEVVRVKLTQSLGAITGDLIEEAVSALHDNLGESKEWQTVAVKEKLLNIVARLTNRVFLGTKLCCNEEWLRISKDYTVDSFLGSKQLSLCPTLLRPLVHWILPSCIRLRASVKAARTLIMEEVEARLERAQKALEVGGKPPKVADVIGWMVEVSRGRPVDYVAAQLALGMAAIHTTSETTGKCIAQLCQQPEIADLLRREIVDVLGAEGWSRVSFYKLKLMDSFLKEVQRTRGLSMTTMNRMTKAPVTLSDGTILAANTRIMVSDDRVNDSSVFPEPEKFDLHRFLRMREQPGEENRHQFVKMTPEHMPFGYGQHVCPGRFFASNEMKILLSILLLNYDIKSIEGEQPRAELEFEAARALHPSFKIQVRKREADIEVSTLVQGE